MQLHACLAGTSTATASLKAAVHVSESDELNDPTTFINSQHLEDTAGVGLSPAGAIAKRCLVVGCKHKSSFKSAYGLTRHTQTVHGTISAKRFVCGARGCFNGHLPWSFARPDKLLKSRQRTSITHSSTNAPSPHVSMDHALWRCSVSTFSMLIMASKKAVQCSTPHLAKPEDAHCGDAGSTLLPTN
jgi:hypothetical protein